MHSAWYVDQTMIDRWGKIGRSEGCFAMSPADFNEALWRMSGGRLLYADRIGDGQVYPPLRPKTEPAPEPQLVTTAQNPSL